METLLSCPGDLLTRVLSWFPSEKGGRGQPPVNVRVVGERHKIVRQTDSGLRVDAWAGPGVPRVLTHLCPSSLSLMTFVMDGISLAGSRQLDLTFFPLRAFLGILAHFSMWNLESFYPGNPSEWLLIRIALDVRLMRSDIYMTFNRSLRTLCIFTMTQVFACV